MRILQGDCRSVLATLPDESVHCVVTSPPYFGLRDYQTAKWEGGDPACGHVEMAMGMSERNTLGPNKYLPPTNAANVGRTRQFRHACGKCGARRIDNQIGLEPTPDAYVAELVAVFREVKRVLRKDGVAWINLGDSYAQSEIRHRNKESDTSGLQTSRGKWSAGVAQTGRKLTHNLKPKDLIGIPWRVAFALQADGWYLRQDIIWSKPNPMPESVRDRCTKAHETIFLLSKSPRYYFDADAIREGVREPGIVQAADLNDDGLIFGQYGGGQGSNAGTADVCVRLAASILDLSHAQEQFGLAALDTEVGHQGAGNRTSTRAISNPIVRRAAAQASRFADGDVSAKEFLRQMHSLCVALPDGDDLKELWISAGFPAATAVPFVNANGDRAVAINDARKVSKIERFHNQEYSIQDTRSSHMKDTPRNDGDRWREVDGGVAARGTRNRRSVWEVATQPFAEAHFATFPPALIEPCILAGCPERCCAQCGAPWVRETKRIIGDDLSWQQSTGATGKHAGRIEQGLSSTKSGLNKGSKEDYYANQPRQITLDWSPSCSCNAPVVPATVLDPFAGAGTTGLVADRLKRDAILIELNPEYAAMAAKRLQQDAGMFSAVILSPTPQPTEGECAERECPARPRSSPSHDEAGAARGVTT